VLRTIRALEMWLCKIIVWRCLGSRERLHGKARDGWEYLVQIAEDADGLRIMQDLGIRNGRLDCRIYLKQMYKYGATKLTIFSIASVLPIASDQKAHSLAEFVSQVLLGKDQGTSVLPYIYSSYKAPDILEISGQAS
jgi:hypothetical protein